MPFSNPTVAGTALAIPSIHSPGYVPGVSGWSINRDGSVEFASGTFRGPVIIIDSVTGNVLASIGATGNGAFQNLSVTGDILIDDVSLQTLINGQGRGLVSSITLSGALPSTGNNVFVNTAWIEWAAQVDRMYRIRTTPFEIVNPGGPVGVDQVRARLVLSSPDGGFAGTVYDSRTDVDEQESIVAEYVFRGTANAVQRAQLACLGVGVVMTLPNPSNSFVFTVEDIGSFGSATHIGGSGTATGTSQFTKQYVCTASRTYDENGVFIGSPDGDNNLYSGDFVSRAFGFESALWIFPGATIRSDLSGATIQSARMWLYCHTCDDTGGDIQYSWRTNTTIPATDPGLGSGEIGRSNVYPVPGWGFINLLTNSELQNHILGGIQANSVRIRQNILVHDATGWRGFGFSVQYRPYIEITYTK